MEPNQPISNQPSLQPPPEAASTGREGQSSLKTTKEKVLFTWRAPARPFRRRNKEFFTTVLAIAFLLSVILFFIEGAMAVAVVIAVVFLVYVLSTVAPEEIEHKITDQGIYFAGRKRFWDEFIRFWITRRFDNDLLVFEGFFFPGRLEMVINPQDKETLHNIIEEYLPYEEAEPRFFDKAAAWLSKKVPLEG